MTDTIDVITYNDDSEIVPEGRYYVKLIQTGVSDMEFELNGDDVAKLVAAVKAAIEGEHEAAFVLEANNDYFVTFVWRLFSGIQIQAIS